MHDISKLLHSLQVSNTIDRGYVVGGDHDFKAERKKARQRPGHTAGGRNQQADDIR